jgi:hypothetical protein
MYNSINKLASLSNNFGGICLKAFQNEKIVFQNERIFRKMTDISE